MNAGITRDDWLKAMQDAGIAQDTDQDAVSVSEFAGLFDLPTTTARNRLQQLVEVGKARETRKMVRDSQNRATVVIAYRLVEMAGPKAETDAERQAREQAEIVEEGMRMNGW